LALTGSPEPGHVFDVEAVAIGQADGQLVAVTGGRDGLALWRIDQDGLAPVGDPQPGPQAYQGFLDARPEVPYQWVSAVAVGQAGGRLVAVTGGHDGMVWLWAIGKDGLVSYRQPRHKHYEGLPRPVSPTVSAVAIGQAVGEAVAVTGGTDGTVRLWRIGEDELVPAGDPHPGHGGYTVLAAAIGQIGGKETVVTGGLDGTIALWHLGIGGLADEPTARIPVGSPPVSLAFRPAGRILAWCRDGVLLAAIPAPSTPPTVTT
jgi:WD40 repeat protein